MHCNPPLARRSPAQMSHVPGFPKLILASRSPRRRQLLAEAGYWFEVASPAETAESGLSSGETPAQLVARLAYQKAADVASRFTSGVVLGCDTIVECGGEILGKPKDLARPHRLLKLLGREHRGQCLCAGCFDRPPRGVDVTARLIVTTSKSTIWRWCLGGKAGAFGSRCMGWCIPRRE